jgi:hypothetical protein
MIRSFSLIKRLKMSRLGSSIWARLTSRVKWRELEGLFFTGKDLFKKVNSKMEN